MATLELFSYEPKAGLPSIDPICLVVQAYLNLTKVNWVLRTCGSASISLNGWLPLLRYGGMYVNGLNEILQQLSRMGLDLDSDLPEEQQTEVLMYKVLLSGAPLEALLRCIVEHTKKPTDYNPKVNYKSPIMKDFESKFILRKRDIPADLIFKISRRLAAGRSEHSDKNFEDEVNVLFEILCRYTVVVLTEKPDKKLDRCYSAIDQKLKGVKGLLYERPTSIDAYIAGIIIPCCSPLYLGGDKYYSRLSKYPHLLNYATKLRKLVFGIDPTPSKYVHPPLYRFNPSSYLRNILKFRSSDGSSSRQTSGLLLLGGIIIFLLHLRNNFTRKSNGSYME